MEEIEEDYEDFDFCFSEVEEVRTYLFKSFKSEIQYQKASFLCLHITQLFQNALEEGILFEVDFAEELQKADKKIKR